MSAPPDKEQTTAQNVCALLLLCVCLPPRRLSNAAVPRSVCVKSRENADDSHNYVTHVTTTNTYYVIT